MHLIRALLAAALLVLPFSASAFERSVFQYTHQRWSEESDVPRPVIALAQDRRGYLWVATATGLFRFDGMRFESVSAGINLVSHGSPSAILVRRNGDVWTNFERSGRFAVFRSGRLQFLRAPASPDRVLAMHETRDGTIWVLTERTGLPLLRYRDGRWTSFGVKAGAPFDNPFSMVVTRDGVVWVSFSGAVARLGPEAHRLEVVREDARALGRLSIDPQERIWITDRHGSYPLTGPGARGAPPRLRHPYATDAAEIRGWPRFDRDGNLWIATYYDGIQRVAMPDPRGAASASEARSRVERYTARDGLTSDVTTNLFQDREGNVWIAGEKGIDRFWPATLRFEPLLAGPAAFGDLLLEASDGSVYIGEASTVYRVRPGGRPEPIFRTAIEPRTLCEAPDGAIWIGLTNDKQIFVWRDGKVRRLPGRVPLPYTLYDCAFDARGDYWVTGALGGMARLRAGRWQHMFGPPGDAFVPKSMVRDAKGRLVLHWNDRTLSLLDGVTRRSTAIVFDGYEPDDVALYSPRPDTIFITGEFGLTRVRNGGSQTISARRMPMFSGINGMVQTPEGESWLASPAGILRMASSDLDKALAEPGRPIATQVFGANDGLRSRPHSHTRRAIVRGGDGRLWIATQTGTLWLDPRDVTRNRHAPEVAISALVADKVYRDPGKVTLRAGVSNLQIDFSVLSFSDSRGARVRYRIEGQDSGWIDAGTRRQAFYTNLKPGSYRFHLTAANDSGAWNMRGATVDFVIPPTFVQSWWFVGLCAVLAGLLLWLAYRVRMAQVAGSIRNRLEERLGERERIARELHDTLLQSIQGLVLRFQSVANKMPADGPARSQLETALQRADDIIAEGRDRVQDLRLAQASGDLPEMLKERAMGTGLDPTTAIRILVEGRPRPVHPLVSVELDRIAGEALFNVARHAKASNVEITIRFARRQLAVEIRDDGVGLAPDVLEYGYKPDHFGLIGMRERAERIGGSFSIESSPGMGCAVAMTLPARLAFADHAPRRRLFSRLLRRWKEPDRA